MPERLGRYHLLQLLATGGMGEVFLARQEGPGGFTKTVVIKRILRHLAQDQGFIDGFVNEAQLAAQLQHPNIATVFGLEREGQTWFIAMEYVHGRSLRELLDAVAGRPGGFVPMSVAARLASQALQGLHHAHELTDARGRPLGILHRDVTPENLLVGFNGVVKLVDFGLARAMTGAVTRVGRPRGKLPYMAPELTVSGSAVDRRVDLYGVGVVLSELLRGRLPACVPTTLEALEAPRRPYASDPVLPPALDAVLRRALAPSPEDRYPTALAMSQDLEGWLRADGFTALPSEVAAFLEQLFGREVVEANPAVVPLETGSSTDVLRPVPASTVPLLRASPAALPEQPAALPPRRALGSLPEPISASHAAPRVEAPPPAPTAPAPPAPRRWPRAAVLAGLGLALAGAAAALLLPRRAPPVAEAEVEDAGVPVQGAEGRALELEPADAGADLVDASPWLEPAPPPRATAAARRRGTGRVVLELAPGLQVSYLGRLLGTTPLGPVEVPAGTAVFVLRNPATRTSRRAWVKVTRGGTVVLKADAPARE